jgi:hypothetical protein
VVVVHLIWLLAQCRLGSYDVFVVKSKPCPLFEIRVWIAIGGMWAILKFDDAKEIVILHLEKKGHYLTNRFLTTCHPQFCFDYIIIFI